MTGLAESNWLADVVKHLKLMKIWRLTNFIFFIMYCLYENKTLRPITLLKLLTYFDKLGFENFDNYIFSMNIFFFDKLACVKQFFKNIKFVLVCFARLGCVKPWESSNDRKFKFIYLAAWDFLNMFFQLKKIILTGLAEWNS